MSMTKPRLLTGDRPTGRLHLGHYVGSLKNRVRLQDEYTSFFIIADLHTLTTRPQRNYVREIPGFIQEMVLDYLSVGIDPDRSTLFVQSAIAETYELNLLFEMLVTVPRLERLPSLKDMVRDADLDAMPFGLLGYPVLIELLGGWMPAWLVDLLNGISPYKYFESISRGVSLASALEALGTEGAPDWPYSDEYMRGALPIAYGQLARVGHTPRRQLPITSI